MKKTNMKSIFQVGVVVPDAKATFANWQKYFNINEDSIIQKNTRDLAAVGKYQNPKYYGKESELWINIVRFDMGGLDFEIIEPLDKDGDDMYATWLREHGPGIHHVNVLLEDRDGFAQAMAENDIPVVLDASAQGKTCQFYDLRQQLGAIFECGDTVVGPLAKVFNPDFVDEKVGLELK